MAMMVEAAAVIEAGWAEVMLATVETMEAATMEVATMA
jgi:hypothetical protein